VTPQSGPLLALVGASGANRFAAMLGDALIERGIEIEWENVRLTRANRDDSPARVRLRKRPGVDPIGRDVLLLTDVVHTGMSIAYLIRWLHRNGARNVALCALLDRPSARLVDVPLRFQAFAAPNELVAGFGLTLRPQFADFDAIHTLVPVHEADEDAPV